MWQNEGVGAAGYKWDLWEMVGILDEDSFKFGALAVV